MKKKLMFLVQAALIAAIYVALLFAFQASSSSPIQVRVAECLTVLPYFTPAAIPGLTIGCLLGNVLTGSTILDIIFGPIATLIGAIGSYLLRKHKYLVPLPPILANVIIIPFVLKASLVDMPIWLMMLTIGIGEIISCGLLGCILLFALKRYKRIFIL